ncbi:MAG: helix-turn-helix domain protein [Parcubacteria group bacterium]|nr:helix-turn-helix domain protein [Parcubacteria group bacterium]
MGLRLLKRRSDLGLTQNELAAKLNIRGQQIQKYEYGLSKMSAERLFQFSEILEVPLAYFCEGFLNPPEPRLHSKTSVRERIVTFLEGFGEVDGVVLESLVMMLRPIETSNENQREAA